MGGEKAAKFLSETQHRGAVIESATSVYVEGVWGAHIMSLTLCFETVPTPHGPGKIGLGTGAALTVTLNKYPGAVVGSQVLCAGAPALANTVASGAETVRYGVTSTLGGYAVVVQADGSLRIGNIVISGTDDYQAKVLGDLATGLSNETGRALFDGLQGAQYPTEIHMASDPFTAKCGFDERDPNISNGVGAQADVEYNPDGYDRSPTSTDPPDAALYHELGHANHVQSGTYTPGPDDTYEKSENEEYNTMWGQDGGPSENAYRQSRGFPPRLSHEGFGPTPPNTEY